jgi:hypothetical protein
MSRFSCLPSILLTLVAAGSSFAAAKPAPAAEAIPKVVRAQTFELTDAAGKTRAWLGTLADGTTLLRLYDNEGKQKVVVDSRGEIVVLDAEGKPRVTAGAVEDAYGVYVSDSKGTKRIEVRVSEKDNPSVNVRDSAGTLRGMMLTLGDEPLFALSDGKQNGARLSMDIKESLPTINLWDATGTPRASYSLTEGGFPLLQMCDADGKALAELSTGKDWPSLVLQSQKSRMAAFMGFTDDTDLSLLLQNGQSKTQIGLLLYDTDPTLAIAHVNGNPAASMRIDDDGVPYVRTSDEDNVTIWRSPQ